MADDEQEDMEVTPADAANDVFDINNLPPIEVPPLPAPIISESGDTGRLIITHITNVNFKSYAGKQVLGPFHKSFSSIVGPNGSGKSNVIDSMLFVFGFRASKIRSKKLSVLIHDSEHHRDVDSCTVSVHFQKIKDTGVAADAFEVIPGSQLVVSRTAHRDNSSYYTLNGRRTNFKEVASVLRGNGIDLDHNRFLILQGEVEQIAMMKPKAPNENEDGMLEYLEDIIGSSRYKAPIDTLADRVSKLNELRSEKLNRVKAVEKEKESLEGVKNEAIEYLNLQNEVTHHKNVLYQKYQADCTADEASATAKRDAAKQKADELASRLAEVEGERKAKSKEHQKAIRAYESASKACEEAKASFADLEKRDAKAREDLKHSKATSKKLEKSIETERLKVNELKQAPAVAEKEQAALRLKLEELAVRKTEEEENRKKVLDGLKTETQGLQDKKSILEQQLLSLQKDLSSKKSQRDIAQSELDLARSTHSQEVKKLESMRTSHENIKSTLEQKQRDITDMKTRLPQTQQTLSKCEKDLENAATSETALNEKLRAARSRAEEGRIALQSARSRGAVLESLLEQRRQGKINSRVLGRLGDLGAIDSKYDVAVSTACGPLDNIVVDTVDVAQRCVEYLKKSGVGAATFICLDKMTSWAEQSFRKLSTPENVPRLFDLITYKDEQLRGAFYYAVRDTLVANDLDQATRVAYGKTRYRVVTLTGQLIDISGTMSGGGGRPQRGRMGGSVAALDVTPDQQAEAERTLREVQTSLDACRENRAKLAATCDKLRSAVKELQHGLDKCTVEIKGLTEQEASLKGQLVEQEVKVKSTVPDPAVIERLEKQFTIFDKDYQQAAKESSKIEDHVQRLHKEIMEVGGSKLKSVEARLNSITSEIAAATSQITKIGVGVKTAERNLKKTENKLSEMEKELSESLKTVEDIEKRLLIELEEQGAAVMEAQKVQLSKLKEAEAELATLNKVVNECEEQRTGLQKESVDAKHELRKYEELVAESRSKVMHWHKELSKLKLNSVDSVGDDESSGTSNDSTLPVKSAEELANVNKEEITASIASISERLSAMRPNMAAIAEYRKKEELYIQRVADLDTVTEARDAQRRQHDELRKRRLDEFMAGFAVITRHLKEMYQMITLGGDAELELVDSLDPFSEGVVFSVRPPKKSWKNIANLSGGEKTLSSLALVFALHHFKPTPLYVMDEIDAALDFKNVSIVANYIKERTKNAQFIIISLRNNMFELADRLIGIYKTDNCTKSVAINPKELSFTIGAQCSTSTTTAGAPVATAVVPSVS